MYGPPNLGTHISTNKPIKQDQSGLENEDSRLSEGIGFTFYNRDDYMQNYEGRFVWNNMHGYGEYQWQSLKYKYEGQFYANKKEGYGRFSYPSGAYFEGLYRNDQRFGPGIYTNAAGYQDVGIWVASKLIRLSRISEPDHIMPRLAITDEDKIRILRYRQIIHLQKDNIKHVAEILLESLTHLRNYDKSVLARAEELYNQLCRDDRSPSFNRPRYDETFFGHESDQLTIDVPMTEEIQQKIEVGKEETIEIEDLLSVVTPQIKESKIIHEMYNSENIRVDNQYNSKISQQDVNVEMVEDQIQEEEADYCGIKQIDLDTMNNIFLLGNHEKLWNIFQSSAVTMPQNFLEDSDTNSSSRGNVQNISKTEVLEEEFDDFGKKKIKDVRPTKKIIVTDLLAWNNSPILIELLKHVFKHRNFEKKLSFDISKILAGRRGTFRQEGTHEKAALEFLEACSNGSKNRISKLISRENLDVDVADSRGNTGLLLAAARDQVEVIDILLNLGANVDSINDECLTPLSLCVLRLLELIHSVTNWSKAFLPQTIVARSVVDDESTVLENFEQWHGRISCESLVQQLPKRMDLSRLSSEKDSEFISKDFLTQGESAIGKAAVDVELGIVPNEIIKARAQQNVIQKLEQRSDMRDNCATDNSANKHSMQIQKYIFDISPIIETSNSWRKFKNDKTKSRNNIAKMTTTIDKKAKEKSVSLKGVKKIKSKELLKNFERMQDTNSIKVSAKEKKICATISKLLWRGADPNFAQVPYPVIIMAIFTKMPSLVTELLKHGADPDTTLSKIDYSLTPLLILAVLQPSDKHAHMAKALLKAKADPSIRADPYYRSDLIERFKRNRLSEFIDNSEGMTALHLLAIRPDMNTDVNGYLEELIGVIYQHRCIKKSDLYLGHSPLSLAVLEGNLIAVEAFLRTTCVNVNEQLGADLGSAMLMLESCELQKLLPPDLLHELIELLLEYGGCPFASATVLKKDYNQIEYGRKELIKMSNPTENKIEIKEKKKKSKSNESKSSKPQDTSNFAESMNFIEKIAKEKLIERIRANFVRDLMDSPIMLLSLEKRSELLKEPIFKNALTWMTGEDIATVMKTMNYNRSNVQELVRLFVTACILPSTETFSETHTLIQNETERIVNKIMPLVDPQKHVGTVANLKVDRHVDKGETNNLKRIAIRQSESDLKDDRFNVCFECLAVHEKVLILCPKCKRVYFCSQECNSKCATQKGNLHQCPVFYQKEWIRLEKIALTIGIDPMSYMLSRFKDPEIYIDVEKQAEIYVKQEGKKSSKNQDDNTYTTTPKYEDQDSTDDKKYAENEFVDENRKQHVYKDKSAHETKGKQQKRNGIIKSEDDDNDIKSNKRLKKDRAFYREDKETSHIKSNEENMDNLFDNQQDPNRDIKSKNTKKKGRGFDTTGDVKNVFNKLKLKKGIEKSHENGNDKIEKASKNNAEWKDGKKNKYVHAINEVEKDGGNKIKSKKEKKRDQIEEDGSNNIKSRKDKSKNRELSDKKEDNNLKFKNKDNHWRSKMGKERSNDFYRNQNDHIKDHLERKYEARSNKQELKDGINKKKREGELTASNESHKNNRHYVETNVPEKYLDWLLKVSRSAGENLDIDMLLMPYVVFAQGDTYFRILPANQYPKFAGNYSLI